MAIGNASGSGEACTDEQIPEPTALLLLPLLFSLFWVLLDLFHSSTILGWLVNRWAALLLTDSGIHLGERPAEVMSRLSETDNVSGSIQLSPLTGRVLFKDVHYYCRDYAIRSGHTP